MRVMRLIIESIDLFILWMINHDKSLESFNSDALKPCDGWENGWYYLEQFMSSWWVKIKSELLVVFENCFTLIEFWQLRMKCKLYTNCVISCEDFNSAHKKNILT